MSLHVVLVGENVPGQRRRLVFDLSFMGTYPSGGEPLTPRQLMLWSVESVIIEPRAGFTFTYDRLTERLHVYGLEVVGSIEDLPVVFTEPDDPLGTPAKVPAGTSFNLLSEADEVPAGTDLSSFQHLQLIAEGF
jgi:hypothetical protein